MKSPNAWQRLGVVATVVWMVVVAVHFGADTLECWSQEKPWSCSARASGPYMLSIALGVGRIGIEAQALFYALAGPAFAWLAVYAAIFTARWVAAGRKA